MRAMVHDSSEERADNGPQPGDSLYVPASEVASAMSFGAVMVEGDARLRIPSPLPANTSLDQFRRWTTPDARIAWIADYLEAIIGAPVDLLNIAGLIDSAALGMPSGHGFDDRIPLYVPTFDMDRVRAMRGVSWDRRKRVYVASREADYNEIYPYLTPAMRAIWIADRNLDVAMGAMVRARAIMEAGPKD